MSNNNSLILSQNYSKIVEESSTCPICLKIAEEAMESQCCGFIFCQKCIYKLIKYECPCCRELRFKYHPALSMRKLIKTLPVKCECGYIDSNDNIKKHYMYCNLRTFTCDILKCQVVLKREDFLEHVVKEHSEVILNVSENFHKLFSTDIQKKIKDIDFKKCLKDRDEIIIYNGNSNKLNTNYFDEIIEFGDDDDLML